MSEYLSRWKKLFLELLAGDSVPVRLQTIALCLILLLCLAVRIAHIDAPALDRTTWKEIDYIEITSNYMKNGFDFAKPEINWPAEPPRTTAMELPLVPYLTALVCSIAGFHAFSVRLITLLSFLVITVYTYRLARLDLGPLVALIAAFAASVFPLAHYHGNMLFSEPAMIALSVMAIFHFRQWSHSGSRREWILSALFFALAVALKLEPLYLLLPLAYIAYGRYGTHLPSYRFFAVFVVCSLSIAAVWFSHAYHIAQTSLDVYGIFGGLEGGHDKFQTLGMLSDPEWYRIMAHRIAGMAGKTGVLLLMAGVAVTVLLRIDYVFFFYLLAVGAYFLIVAEGNIDGPYRQMVIIPPLSVFAALGALAVSVTLCATLAHMRGTGNSSGYKIGSILIACVLVAMIVADKRDAIFGRDPFLPASPDQWIMAKELRKYAGEGDKIITLGAYSIHKGGNDLSPVFYYYAGLQGWSLQKGQWNMETAKALMNKGARYLVAHEMIREPESAPFMEEVRKISRVLYEDEERRSVILELDGQSRSR